MSDMDRLGEQYPMTDLDEDKKTKDKILLTSVMMFTEHGYEGTSIKDITTSLGITPSTLYNHFKSKEALWDAVMDHATQLYMIYFQRLIVAMEEVQSMKDILDAMFVELLEVVSIHTYYCFSLVMSERNRDSRAGGIYCNIFLKYSIDFIAKEFDKAVERGWAIAFDTNTVATVFMHSVLHGINVRVQEDLGRNIPYNVNDMFERVKQQLFNISQGYEIK